MITKCKSYPEVLPKAGTEPAKPKYKPSNLASES